MLAINFNGDGPESANFAFYSCTPPSQAIAPTRVATTVSTMTVMWEDPLDNGGCSITSFAVFVDDGQLGSFTEVNSVNDPNVRGNPGIHSLVISSPFTLASIGESFRVKIVSYNVDGETESAVGTIVLGDVPDAPTTVVEKITTGSSQSSNKLSVQFAALPSSGNNGLPILSYSLEIDYNLSGSF